MNKQLVTHLDFEHVFTQVRELKKKADMSGDVASYHDAMRQIEHEMNKIKDLYQTELDRLR